MLQHTAIGIFHLFLSYGQSPAHLIQNWEAPPVEFFNQRFIPGRIWCERNPSWQYRK